MSVQVKVPSVGESISEGAIARWLKNDGDMVKANEPLFELETEKATQEVPSPATGVLKIAAKEGQTVPIGAVVATIDPQATPSGGRQPPVPPPQQSVDAAAAKKAPAPQPKESPPHKEDTPSEKPLSPAARRLAAEEHVDLEKVEGTGKHGVVLKTDVQQHLDKPKETAGQTPPRKAQAAGETQGETRRRMSAIRQRIAERLVASQQTTASLTTFNEADLSAVTELRSRYKDKFKETHGVGLGFMSFFVKACVEALRAYPIVNSRIEGSEVVTSAGFHIGVAVSTEKGLMVPVLHDAERLSFAEIEQSIADLAVKARDGKIQVADLQGGTFTITNGGVFGSMLSTPILNPPQSAILGMHSIQKRPVVRDDQIVIRPMMYLALTYDHRLVDGREAVLFLVRVKECLEDPERMLLEV